MLNAKESMQSIQFLRFFAAALVVLFHSYGAMNSGHLHAPAMTYVFGFGAVGVHLFFVISGYVMLHTIMHQKPGTYSTRKFITKRAIRIYPTYWLFAIFYIVVRFLHNHQYELGLSDYIKSFLLLPGSSPLIIGPGWTLSFELYFYLCFGISMYFGIIRGIAAMTLFFLGSVVVGIFINSPNPYFALMTNTLLLEFLSGVWIAYILSGNNQGNNRFAPWIIACAILSYAGGLLMDYARYPSAVIWGLPSALLLIGMVLLEKANKLPALMRNLAFLGDSSYVLYLAHIVLIDLFIDHIWTSADSSVAIIAFCMASTLACCVLAHLVHSNVERPLMEFLRRRLT